MSHATSQIESESLRYMALTYLSLTYLSLLEQSSSDEDDIRVAHAISMHPKIQALMACGDEIEEAGK